MHWILVDRMTEKRSAFPLVSGMMNPWDVQSLEDFNFLCCPECVYRSKDPDNFQRHAVGNHPQSVTFFDKDIEIKPFTVPEVNFYVKEEQEESNQCQHCEKTFSSISKLRDHERCHQYKMCESCGKGFSKSAFQAHADICKLDKANKKFQCHSCPFKTHAEFHLTKHKRLYHSAKTNIKLEGVEVDENGRFKCPECSKILVIRDYVRHYKTSHGCYPPGYPSEKIIRCDLCTSEFLTKTGLNTHMKKFHPSALGLDQSIRFGSHSKNCCTLSFMLEKC